MELPRSSPNTSDTGSGDMRTTARAVRLFLKR
jgi:hypothetical protein